MDLPRAVPQIETARLRLRSFTAADRDAYTQHIFADADVMRFLPKREIAPHERAARTIVFFDDHWSQRGYGVWAVTDKHTGHFIGHCGLGDVPEAGEVEIMYALRRSHWGQGIATEAARASVRFAFKQTPVTRLVAFAVPENIGSRRVMEHLGFEYEKDAHYFGLDLVQYALHRGRFHADDSVFLIK